MREPAIGTETMAFGYTSPTEVTLNLIELVGLRLGFFFLNEPLIHHHGPRCGQTKFFLHAVRGPHAQLLHEIDSAVFVG